MEAGRLVFILPDVQLLFKWMNKFISFFIGYVRKIFLISVFNKLQNSQNYSKTKIFFLHLYWILNVKYCPRMQIYNKYIIYWVPNSFIEQHWLFKNVLNM